MKKDAENEVVNALNRGKAIGGNGGGNAYWIYGDCGLQAKARQQHIESVSSATRVRCGTAPPTHPHSLEAAGTDERRH